MSLLSFFVHSLWCFGIKGIKYVMHSSHKGKPHIHRLSNKFARSVITLHYYIIFKWYQHLSWFVFLPKLKTKNLGANSVFESDPGELCEQAGQWDGEGGKSTKPEKKHLSAGHCGPRDSVPLDTTECSLCEWRSWGTCLPTVSVFMFAWSPWALLPAGPSSFHGQKMTPGKRGRKALGRGNHLQWCWWTFHVPVCFICSLFIVIQLFFNEAWGHRQGPRKGKARLEECVKRISGILTALNGTPSVETMKKNQS